MDNVTSTINNILSEMSSELNDDQLEHLGNTLYINLHGYKLVEECTELAETGVDGDEAKIRMFIMAKRALNRKPSTLRQYVREIHNVLKFLGKRIEDITSADLMYYYGYMREIRGITASTMQTRLHYLSSFWEFLISEELVMRNPVKKVSSVKVDKKIKKPYTSEELEALRLACSNYRDRAVIEFLYSSGLRVSEMVALNVGDIDMAKEEFTVYGKGGKERVSYLTDNAKFYLRIYLETRKNEEDLLNKPLFETLDKPHTRLSAVGVRRMMKELGERAGVSDVHPHRFRRTIATELLNKGMPIEQVKEFLGHENIDTTLIYCTIGQEEVKASHRKYA